MKKLCFRILEKYVGSFVKEVSVKTCRKYESESGGTISLLVRWTVRKAQRAEGLPAVSAVTGAAAQSQLVWVPGFPGGYVWCGTHR